MPRRNAVGLFFAGVKQTVCSGRDFTPPAGGAEPRPHWVSASLRSANRTCLRAFSCRKKHKTYRFCQMLTFSLTLYKIIATITPRLPLILSVCPTTSGDFPAGCTRLSGQSPAPPWMKAGRITFFLLRPGIRYATILVRTPESRPLMNFRCRTYH